jgi:hypothetical protein
MSTAEPAELDLLKCKPAYVSIRQNMPEYVSIRQHTSACVSIYVSIRQHTSAYNSIRQHTSAYVLAYLALRTPRDSQRRAHHQLPSPKRTPHSVQAPAYVSIRQHTSAYTSAYVSIRQESIYTYMQRTRHSVQCAGLRAPGLCGRQVLQHVQHGP